MSGGGGGGRAGGRKLTRGRVGGYRVVVRSRLMRGLLRCIAAAAVARRLRVAVGGRSRVVDINRLL